MRPRRVDQDKRRVERIPVQAPLPAEITIAQPARLIEISQVGARIESTIALRLGDIHDLQLNIDGIGTTLRARIIHCHLSQVADAGAIYTAGVEFLDLPDAVGDRVRAYIGRLESADRS